MASSIIMGKSPSDVDIIGLSKTIHMRSCEKQLNFTDKTVKNSFDRASEEETESTTPI